MLFGRRPVAGGVDLQRARGPDGMVLYAIGDVHGRLDLLSLMYAEIAADRERRRAADWRIIHLGDYVDRGPDSKGVIDFLIEACRTDERVTCLAGNHDIGFLEFLSEPDPNGLFANYGGRQTALSYGAELDAGGAAGLALGHRTLKRLVPEAHVAFLGGLRYSLDLGDFFFCHAGIRPGVALDAQDPLDMVWIREMFLHHRQLYPKVVVHGHTPVPAAEMLADRVSLDTGAFATGRLTALVIEGGEKELLVVEQPT